MRHDISLDEAVSHMLPGSDYVRDVFMVSNQNGYLDESETTPFNWRYVTKELCENSWSARKFLSDFRFLYEKRNGLTHRRRAAWLAKEDFTKLYE